MDLQCSGLSQLDYFVFFHSSPSVTLIAIRHLLAKLQTFGAVFNAHLVATCLDERHAPSLAHAHALPSSMYPPVNLALLPPLPLHVPPHHAAVTAAATQPAARISLKAADISPQARHGV
jgi:hypothetical protein